MPTPPTPPAPPTPPRIILERQPNGDLVVEYYINGTKSRTTLMPGFEGDDIHGIFVEIALSNRAAAERKAAALAAKAEELHRRVWFTSASRRGQGPEFADRVIGPLKPRKATPTSRVTSRATSLATIPSSSSLL